MATPYLVPCLVTLRAEFNQLSPNRDKGSDGWIGDTAHQASGSASDHNPRPDGRVLAIDIDSTGPWPVPFDGLVESLRGDARLEYIIWNRRIASRDRGWTWRSYSGTSDPHTGHAHLSARHDLTGNSSTAPWGLLEDIVTPDDISKIAAATRDSLLNATFGRGDAQRTVAAIWVESRDNTRALLGQAPDGDEIAAAVLAGLTPERLSAAITGAGLTPAALAAAIPPEIAKDVADELHARLAA